MPDSPSVQASSPRFQIRAEIEGSYLATSEGGRETLLVPVTDSRPPLERSTGDVILSFRAQVRFDVLGSEFTANAAIIECANVELGETFRVLATDIAHSLRAGTVRPTPQEVSLALSRWEELLRSKRVLSRDEELGLWGELWLLLQLPATDMAVSSWRGPDAEWVDFVGGGLGIECKTSRRRLEHFVSQEQLTRPLGDLEVYLLSLWVDTDAVAGQTLSDLVTVMDGRLGDRREFEEKLLVSGYSRVDAHRYKLRLRVLEPPILFRTAEVPRVRELDPGVSHVRFMVSLDEGLAIPAPTALSTMMRLCVALSPPTSV